MTKSKKFLLAVRERAVRMLQEHRANDISKMVCVFFAQAQLDRRLKS